MSPSRISPIPHHVRLDIHNLLVLGKCVADVRPPAGDARPGVAGADAPGATVEEHDPVAHQVIHDLRMRLVINL
jgi:hypothetical protein